MCGIQLFLTQLKDKHIRELFIKLFTNIKVRGPEATEMHEKTFGNFNLNIGFQRLKINDISDKGNQPFIFDNDEMFIAVMINGEIYNHKELEKEYQLTMNSNSDCEVVFHLIKKFINTKLDFSKLFNKLDGVFAGCVYYQNKYTKLSHIITFRDIYGVRPMYYGEDDYSIGISSELKGLVGLVGNIKQFPPGHFMRYTLNDQEILSKEISRFYQYKFPIINASLEEVLGNIRTKFEQAVCKRMMSDRPLCCLLSGGLDSSLVASVLAKFSTKKIHTFCVGMEGGEDFKYAKMVADHIKSIHHEIVLQEKDFLNVLPEVVRIIETFDGTTCRASTGQYLVSKYIKENTDFKVVYVGEGSDELTGGYMYFHNAPNEIEFDKECKRLMRDLHFYDNKRSDRAVSHFGLETRVPFLDKEFTEYYLSIDPKLRFHKNSNNKIEKYLLRKAFDTEISGYNYLPNNILWRKKEAFSDGVSSKKHSWYQVIQNFVKIQIGKEYELNKNIYGNYLMPYTEELYFYRKIFTEHYGLENATIIPYFWLPKWSGNVIEASARVLDVYKN
ncbi:putative asparagine synthetase B [Cafeteria roenbergensis virus]|uniref:asparagine synthase (glutamine-hydrolyzing) n=1 Tax=Cafeteria roenbergensis virus (strain BV-PW1) TaxID=693272 RepID=E3T4J5_CROVB|nr:putative asparagine synthetase B [Cafeteria roenbergensis virus BV-PW1]ADO67108.1 putative asparagine synthetase B [Cafeteria roenbergensis virus BV-PW1]